MKFTSPPGVFDIIPINSKEQWKSSYLWSYIETKFRQLAFNYGLQEIRTPIFEKTELLQRGVGESSDIVNKEMYTFQDKAERSLTLRPEGTAPLIRAYIENQLQQQNPVQKLFYVAAPMFRYERAQAGRYRQHHQLGVEIIGIKSPKQDAELIEMSIRFYTSLGLKNLNVYINSIGSKNCRANYKKALEAYLKSNYENLSSDSQSRFHKNILRILDSKDLNDRKIIAEAPSILDYLTPESKEYFENLQKALKVLNISFTINPFLVRGLDYYNHTVFEIVTGDLGAQNSLSGGGRYDGLLATLGGPDLAAVGFGLGIERLIQCLINQRVPLPSPPHALVFLIPLGEKAEEVCFKLQQDLRSLSIAVEMDYTNKKLQKSLKLASQTNIAYVVIVGEEELTYNQITFKEMKTSKSACLTITTLKKLLQIHLYARDYLKLESKKEINPLDFIKNDLLQNIKENFLINDEIEKALETFETILSPALFNSFN